MASIETEIALLVVAERPGAVADEIAALQQIGDYRLRPLDGMRIRDTYFDFPDRRLGAADISLRRRRQQGEELVTLKGPAERLPGGGKRRPELEEPWSPGAAAAVWQALHESGVSLGAEPDGGVEIGSAIRAVGLAAIQERVTSRRRRAVLSSESATAVLAELDIDRVAYVFPSLELRIDEVEIEAAANAAPTIMHAVARELLEMSAGTLRPWPHSKLSTGAGLAAMLEAGELEGRIRPGGDVDASALEALDFLLTNGTSPD